MRCKICGQETLLDGTCYHGATPPDKLAADLRASSRRLERCFARARSAYQRRLIELADALKDEASHDDFEGSTIAEIVAELDDLVNEE